LLADSYRLMELRRTNRAVDLVKSESHLAPFAFPIAMLSIKMSPIPTQEQLSEAVRVRDGKFPEIFHVLAENRISQDSDQTWITTAKILLRRDELERCKGILKAFRESNPENITATLLLSNACQRLGSEHDLDESVMLARNAVSCAVSPEDTLRASLQLAVSLGSRARLRTRQQVERQHDRDEAIQLLSSLDLVASASGGSSTTATTATSNSSSSSNVAQGLYTLALLQAEQGGSHAAKAKATAVSAWQAAQAAKDPQLTALNLVLLSTILSAGQGHKAALSCLSQAPTSTAATAEAPRGSAEQALWSDVLVCRLRSRLQAALSDAGSALTELVLAKKLLAGWLERGPLPAGVSRGMAEEELAKVWGELAVAIAQADSAQKAEALAAIDHALALRPWTAAIRHAVGSVHEALGQYEEAAAAYDDALALDPTHAPTLLRKGALHVRHGSRPDLAVARDLLAEALRYEPRAAAGWYELGRVASALEHRAEAEEHMLMAVRLASEAPALDFSELPLAPPGISDA
ncbi:hypothetical protein Vafri_7391, partial [Volvox africanus]